MKRIFYGMVFWILKKIGDFIILFCLVMSTYLGQNFLKDSAMRSYIGSAIAKMYEETRAKALMEIGPGKWAITRKIKDISKDFFVVEKDLTMESHLREAGLVQSQIVFWDFLEVDVAQKLQVLGKDIEQTLAVWNLPYYITSPIFRKLFTASEKCFLWWIFMIQDEVWQKIISSAQKKSYLWWLLNWWYEVKYLKMVPPKCFSPAPKVKSCLVKFVKKERSEPVKFQTLELFLNLFAPYSRKTLGRIAKMIEKKQEGGEVFVIPESLAKKRLEELTWDDIAQIIGRSDA